MKYLNKFDFLVFCIAVSLSLYLVLRWLPPGTIIAGGDIGVPNLFPNKILKDVISSWWDTHGTGISSPTTYTAIPYYLFLSFLDSLGFQPHLTQKIVFLIALTGGMFSIYLVSLALSFGRWISLIAALFYVFNLTSLTIWHRGIHNTILFFFLAPFSLLILIEGIKFKKYTSIILINMASFILSYVFGTLGYIFSVWLLWIIYIMVRLLDSWKDLKLRKFLLFYFILLVISWIGTNLWWFIHLLQASGYVLGQFSTEEIKSRGSDVLVGLKSYMEPSLILRGINKYYQYVIKDWGDIYLNPLFILLSWIPTIIIFATTLIKSNYKSSSWKFLFLLTIIVLFISKGANPPLEMLNKVPYNFFGFLAPLRNPYEKVGVLLMIPFSLLFGLGIYQINSYLKWKKISFLNPLVFLAAIICVTVLVWPLWLGNLYTSDGKKLTVTFPPYYFEANKWMASKTKADDTRILHLPLAWWESVDYNWGYSGIEPSQSLFFGSSIGYHLDIPAVDSRIRNILLLVHSQNTTVLQKAFASLNIGWVIIHNETLFRDRMLEPPERINAWLATNPYFLEKAVDFGPLSVWRVKDEYRTGHFYSTEKLISLKNMPNQLPQKTWDYIENINDSFITIQDGQESLLEKFLEKSIVFPKRNETNNVDIILNEDSSEDLVNKSFNIPNIDITSSYQISFEVLKSGTLFLSISHDNDPLGSDDKVKPAIMQEVQIPDQIIWQKVIFNYNPPLNAASANLTFTQSQNKSIIKNLKVKKNIKPIPILEEIKTEDSKKLGKANVKWNKISPTLYELELSQQSTPFVMVFSETFHPQWQLSDISGKKIEIPHFTINGFANGWLVEQPLPEKLKVEFGLQSLFKKGILISSTFFIFSSAILSYLDYRRRHT